MPSPLTRHTVRKNAKCYLPIRQLSSLFATALVRRISPPLNNPKIISLTTRSISKIPRSVLPTAAGIERHLATKVGPSAAKIANPKRKFPIKRNFSLHTKTATMTANDIGKGPTIGSLATTNAKPKNCNNRKYLREGQKLTLVELSSLISTRSSIHFHLLNVVCIFIFYYRIFDSSFLLLFVLSLLEISQRHPFRDDTTIYILNFPTPIGFI
ncbi:hypothetical protein TRFO_30688 [Tritrichomonas foetus]|uniref:Uncharacterized protein n=1 Tax=Tritrichomonas foetus TaxID=1144522 RepID=A0A1J4JXK1_9EUKA|nr:hypothetical protein TRFO_30688 [Tritrichomonas foetus]|eukprot:OHT02262.1 hypothetical protein TRFO_30688 [Tritrichomonas foetus]